MPKEKTDAIYKEQTLKLLQWTFDQIVSDQRVSDEEEERLTAMAKNLRVTLKITTRPREWSTSSAAGANRTW